MSKVSTGSVGQGVTELTKKFEFNYKLLVALAAGFAPVAYLIGFAFHQGMLSAYGISSDMFNISTYMTYVNSYFAVGSLINEISSFALRCIAITFSSPLIFLGVVLFVILALASYKKIRKWAFWGEVNGVLQTFSSKLSVVWVKSEVLKAAVIGGFASYLLYTFLTILMAVAVLWWAAPLVAYKLGYHDSNHNIEEYEKSGCCAASSNGFSVCSVLVDSKGNELLKGIMVANSNKFIAFYNEEGATVQEFPEEAKLKSVKVADVCVKAVGDASMG